MASGDVFSDTSLSIGPTALIAIQPAAGVQVCITHTFAPSGSVHFCGGGSTATSIGTSSGATVDWHAMCSGVSMKLLLSNTEFINVLNIHAADTYIIGYTGMEL
tara:strand:- start:394 stop:705 length:312 start_codon:yes stop_codon:yes gene_type:complete